MEYKNINCKICNKVIIPKNGHQARKKYCSKKCKDRASNYIKGNKKILCPDCKKPMTAYSNSCRKCSYKKMDIRAEKNGMWKGGISNNYQMRIYRTILKDNGVDINICSICGLTKEKRMCIHHIDGNHGNNKLENLLPLCFNCHGRSHIKDKVKLVCKYCKKEFEGLPSRQKYRQYCSRACNNKHRSLFA